MRFDVSDFRPAQQGTLDGFCGLYSAVNFICRRLDVNPGVEDPPVEAQKIFQALLKSLLDRGKVTAHRMIDGFQEGHIQKAFNEFCRDRRLGLKARRIQVIAKQRGCRDIFDLIATLAPNEGAIVSVCSGRHWILAHSGSPNQFWLDDSADEPRCKRLRRNDAARYDEISLEDGLVLLNA